MVLDTNILIACLNQDSSVVKHVNAWKVEQRSLLVSSISVTEVLSLPTLSGHDIKVMRAF